MDRKKSTLGATIEYNRDNEFLKKELLQKINEVRIKNDLNPYVNSQVLNTVAMYKAKDMKMHNYWGHISPTGKNVANFANLGGYNFIAIGENLAEDYTNADEIINKWMLSESHRENITSKRFSEVGIYIMQWQYQGVTTTSIIQIYGQPTILERILS